MVKNTLDFIRQFLRSAEQVYSFCPRLSKSFIFGTDAVAEFQETNTPPSEEWLEKNGGHVEEGSFETEAEYDAYQKALEDCDGWMAYDCPENPVVEAPSTPFILQFKLTGQLDWRDFPQISTVENYSIDFPAEFLHNYYSNNYVAWEDDMQKFIDGEIPLEEFKKYGHGITTDAEAQTEMMRLRRLILDETLSDFFTDFSSGNLVFRRKSTAVTHVKYENQIRTMRAEAIKVITEADANPDKWYELFVDEGDEEGTHTVDSGDTFDEAVVNFENYADEYGIENLHLDIWKNREAPQEVTDIKFLRTPSK